LDDISTMSARVNEGESSERAINAMAEEWIAEHREQVDAWLEEARSAAR
jgi:glycine betaine/proline transport system substrate-binding protein